jgi:hypothetical protein
MYIGDIILMALRKRIKNAWVEPDGEREKRK